jgi:hypothetical protein
MRFAGQRVSNFTGGVTGVENYMQDSPDYGMNAQAASNLARQELVNSIGKQSKALNTGILSAADVEGAAITGAANRSLANAGTQAAMMSGIGQIGGAIIGGMNFGGSNIGTNMGKTQYSQPHASGIGREALGGYDM